MSQLKDMRLKREDVVDRMEQPKIDDMPRYPYGLKIHLDKDSYKMVGLSGVPKVGEEYMILAKVEVTDVSKESSASDENKVSCSLQIKEMDIKKEEVKPEPATVLYGGSEG